MARVRFAGASRAGGEGSRGFRALVKLVPDLRHQLWQEVAKGRAWRWRCFSDAHFVASAPEHQAFRASALYVQMKRRRRNGFSRNPRIIARRATGMRSPCNGVGRKVACDDDDIALVATLWF